MKRLRLSPIRLSILILLALVLIALPAACSSSKAPSPAPSVVTSTQGIAPPAMAPMPGSSGKSNFTSDSSLGTGEGTSERMIVRNGKITIVAEDVMKARDEIAQLAQKYGGFVVSSSLFGEGEEMRGSIAIRVDDESFDAAILDIRTLALRVRSENTSSQDVTDQYTDLEVRLATAEAAEKQYLEILQRADKVEDILRVYDSLNNIRLQIEQIKTQMQNIERITAYSLISVTIEPRGTSGTVVRQGWSPLEILKSAVRGIVIFGQVLGTILIWLIIFIPVWGTVVGIIIWRRRKNRKHKAAA